MLVTPMNKQTTRSLSLALLMIAAAFLPLLSAQIDPAELQENRDSAYAPPSPCLELTLAEDMTPE